MADPINEECLAVLQCIAIANPPITSMTINKRASCVDRPRRKAEVLLNRGYIIDREIGYVITKSGRRFLDSVEKKKPADLAPSRTFTKSGEYKGLKLIGIRSGSLDFLSIPAIVNGKEVEVHPCLKS